MIKINQKSPDLEAIYLAKQAETLLLTKNKSTIEWANNLSSYQLKDPSERTSEDMFIIKSTLEECGYFKKNSLKLGVNFDPIAKNVSVETFQKGDYIYKENEVGNATYIVLHGSVELVRKQYHNYDNLTSNVHDYNVNLGLKKEIKKRINKSKNLDKSIDYNKFMKTQVKLNLLQRGDCFGEDCIFDPKYTYISTAIASQRTQQAVIDRKSWEKYYKTISHNGHKETRLRIMQNATGFSEFNNKELNQLYNNAVFQKVDSEKIIFKEKQNVENLFLLLKGEVLVIRNFDIVIDSKGNPIRSRVEGPSLIEKTKGLFKTISQKLDTLQVGECICEKSCLQKQPTELTYVSSLPCEIMIIEATDLKKRISNNSINEIIDGIKFYPDANEMRKIYLEKLDWTTFKSEYKDDITKKILFDKFVANHYQQGHIRIPQKNSYKTPKNILDSLNLTIDYVKYRKDLERKDSPNLERKVTSNLETKDSLNQQRRDSSRFKRKIILKPVSLNSSPNKTSPKNTTLQNNITSSKKFFRFNDPKTPNAFRLKPNKQTGNYISQTSIISNGEETKNDPQKNLEKSIYLKQGFKYKKKTNNESKPKEAFHFYMQKNFPIRLMKDNSMTLKDSVIKLNEKELKEKYYKMTEITNQSKNDEKAFKKLEKDTGSHNRTCLANYGVVEIINRSQSILDTCDARRALYSSVYPEQYS